MDEVRGGMLDSATLGWRRTNRLNQYDNWPKLITYIKKPDSYAGTFLEFGLSAHCNASVRLTSDTYDKPHEYYLGFT